jgi:hypothetical protein
MTLRGTLALAVVLGALVAYLLLTQPVREPEPVPNALTPALGAVSTVELVEAGRGTTWRRRDDTWSAPGVGDLLDALGSLEVLEVIDPAPSDLAIYGLGPDALRLRMLADHDAELVTLEIGAMNPAGTGVYVRRSGQPAVILVGALLRWEIEKLRRVVSTTVPP